MVGSRDNGHCVICHVLPFVFFKSFVFATVNSLVFVCTQTGLDQWREVVFSFEVMERQSLAGMC